MFTIQSTRLVESHLAGFPSECLISAFPLWLRTGKHNWTHPRGEPKPKKKKDYLASSSDRGRGYIFHAYSSSAPRSWQEAARARPPGALHDRGRVQLAHPGRGVPAGRLAKVDLTGIRIRMPCFSLFSWYSGFEDSKIGICNTGVVMGNQIPVLCHRKVAKDLSLLWLEIRAAPCSPRNHRLYRAADPEKLWGRCMHVFLLGNHRVVLHWVELTGPNFGVGIAAARLELVFVGNLPRLRPDRRICAGRESFFYIFVFAFAPRLPQATLNWRDKCTCTCIPSRRPVCTW